MITASSGSDAKEAFLKICGGDGWYCSAITSVIEIQTKDVTTESIV